MTTEVRILLVSGSTRDASTNAAALRTAAKLAPKGVVAWLYDGLSDLPAFNPDHDTGADLAPHPAVARLRREFGAADAVLFCAPEYAGSLPGSLKNLLDWTVGHGDLRAKPAAWINAAPAGRGGGAQQQLATVLRYLDAVPVTAACQHLTVAREAIGADGVVTDQELAARLGAVLAELAAHVRQAAAA